MKKVLLDTNAYSNLLRGDEKIFVAISRADTVYISSIVIGELLTGFKSGKKESDNKELLQKFIKRPTVRVVDVTIETAEIFAQIKFDLKIAGTPIPVNDVWIASHTIETGSTIITYDDHFSKVKGLRVWDHAHV